MHSILRVWYIEIIIIYVDSVSFIEFTLNQHFIRQHHTHTARRRERIEQQGYKQSLIIYSAGLIRGQAAKSTPSHCVFCVLLLTCIAQRLISIIDTVTDMLLLLLLLLLCYYSSLHNILIFFFCFYILSNLLL
jgi:hypothetical protein